MKERGPLVHVNKGESAFAAGAGILLGIAYGLPEVTPVARVDLALTSAGVAMPGIISWIIRASRERMYWYKNKK